MSRNGFETFDSCLPLCSREGRCVMWIDAIHRGIINEVGKDIKGLSNVQNMRWQYHLPIVLLRFRLVILWVVAPLALTRHGTIKEDQFSRIGSHMHYITWQPSRRSVGHARAPDY